MAEPAMTVAPQITDSVTQVNTKLLAETPAYATGNLMQASSNAFALSFQNAVNGQQQANMVHQTSTTEGINILYSSLTAVAGQAVGVINRSTDYSKMQQGMTVNDLFGK